jgi:hypothetical protein
MGVTGTAQREAWLATPPAPGRPPAGESAKAGRPARRLAEREVGDPLGNGRCLVLLREMLAGHGVDAEGPAAARAFPA